MTAEFLSESQMLSLFSLNKKMKKQIHHVCYFSQFFSREEHVIVFSANHETKVWQLCLCTIIANAQHPF